MGQLCDVIAIKIAANFVYSDFRLWECSALPTPINRFQRTIKCPFDLFGTLLLDHAPPGPHGCLVVRCRRSYPSIDDDDGCSTVSRTVIALLRECADAQRQTRYASVCRFPAAKNSTLRSNGSAVVRFQTRRGVTREGQISSSWTLLPYRIANSTGYWINVYFVEAPQYTQADAAPCSSMCSAVCCCPQALYGYY